MNVMTSAECIALAIVNGEVPADGMADALDNLRLLNRRAEIEQQAAALRAFRAGEPVWTWPKTAPWAGF